MILKCIFMKRFKIRIDFRPLFSIARDPVGGALCASHTVVICPSTPPEALCTADL
jgi:hypothetical protein